MIKQILIHLVEWIAANWLGKTKRRVLHRGRIEGIKLYLKALQGLRVGVGVLAMIVVCTQLISAGLVISVVAALQITPVDEQTKAWCALFIGLVLLLIPIVGLIVLLSERLWYRVSGADKMVAEVLNEKSALSSNVAP